MNRTGRIRALMVGLVLVTLASACGARVTDEQRASAGAGGSLGVGGAPAGTAAGDVSPSEGAALGAEDPAAPVEQPPEGGAPEGSPAAAGDQPAPSGAGAAGPAPAPAAPPPSGGNGGATDVGVTPTSIELGLVTTLSGPVPGLFQGAAIGAQAFAAYVNSEGGVYGRKLVVRIADDQFDAGQHRAQVQSLSKQVVGFLGSFSLFDDTAIADLEKAGVPDVGYGLTDGRRNSPVNFSPQPAKAGTFRTGPFLYYKKKFPQAVQAVGTIYGDVPASKNAALDSQAAAESVGWKFVYERAYQPTESDFTADVIRMRQAGVKAFYGVSIEPKVMARILKTMEQQNFKPEFIGVGASGYDPIIPAVAGAAAEGLYVDQQLALYQGGDAAAVPEVALMNQWVQKVKPGYQPVLYTAYSWAAGRILLDALKAAGPQLTRQGLLAALRKVDQFDANGLVAPAGPASKRQPVCDMFMRIQGGKFVRQDPAGKGYVCEGAVFTRR